MKLQSTRKEDKSVKVLKPLNMHKQLSKEGNFLISLKLSRSRVGKLSEQFDPLNFNKSCLRTLDIASISGDAATYRPYVRSDCFFPPDDAWSLV